jgi:hypothetical protein
MTSLVRTNCATLCYLWGTAFQTFSMRVEIDGREKKDLFPLQYSSSNILLFLRQEFQKTDQSTICHKVLLLLFQYL